MSLSAKGCKTVSNYIYTQAQSDITQTCSGSIDSDICVLTCSSFAWCLAVMLKREKWGVWVRPSWWCWESLFPLLFNRTCDSFCCCHCTIQLLYSGVILLCIGSKRENTAGSEIIPLMLRMNRICWLRKQNYYRRTSSSCCCNTCIDISCYNCLSSFSSVSGRTAV